MVNVEDGNITGRSVDQIPVVERSTINTQALIMEGESLLIGGMTRDVSTSSNDKVPGLGDIPVVGNLFKTTKANSARIERMFLITPRLAAARPANPANSANPAVGGAAQRQAPALTSPAPFAPATPAPMPAQPPAVLQAAATPAPATRPQAAPALYTPPARASVVLDLDAMPSRPATRSVANTTR
jgi:type III secretion protein C